MRINEAHLLARGWRPEEIVHARAILQRATVTHSALDHVEYLLVVILGVILNAAIAFFLIPALLVLPAAPLLVILVICGACFGTAYTLILSLLERHAFHKHLIAMTIVPTMALISFVAVSAVVDPTLPTPLPGLVIGATYAIAFLVPYFFGGRP